MNIKNMTIIEKVSKNLKKYSKMSDRKFMAIARQRNERLVKKALKDGSVPVSVDNLLNTINQ